MKKRLLLADDSITIQKVIQITFSHDDYLLTVVDNGDAALEKARAERPDLILADVFMPGRNGYELCAAVKQEPSLAGVPVLLLTGTFEPFDEAKATAAGADKWIAKPFESQSLINCVEEILASASSRPAAIPSAPQTIVERPAPIMPPPLPVQPLAEVSTPPVPTAVAASPVAQPDVAMDDMWGDEFATEPTTLAPGALDAVEPLPVTDDNDLWGGDSFTTSAPLVEPAAVTDDLWGSFEEDVSMPGESIAVAEPFAEEPPVADIWGEVDGLAASFDAEALPVVNKQPVASVPTIELDTIGDAEILEEVELSDNLDSAVASIPMDDVFGFADEESFADLSTPPAYVAEPEPPTLAEPIAPAPVRVVPIPASPEPVAAAPAAPPVSSTVTSVAPIDEAALEKMVEKVAGVVIERLANTILERIAWEVVPDLAEVLIKEELRKIQEEASAL